MVVGDRHVFLPVGDRRVGDVALHLEVVEDHPVDIRHRQVSQARVQGDAQVFLYPFRPVVAVRPRDGQSEHDGAEHPQYDGAEVTHHQDAAEERLQRYLSDAFEHVLHHGGDAVGELYHAGGEAVLPSRLDLAVDVVVAQLVVVLALERRAVHPVVVPACREESHEVFLADGVHPLYPHGHGLLRRHDVALFGGVELPCAHGEVRLDVLEEEEEERPRRDDPCDQHGPEQLDDVRSPSPHDDRPHLPSQVEQHADGGHRLCRLRGEVPLDAFAHLSQVVNHGVEELVDLVGHRRGVRHHGHDEGEYG